MAEIVIKGAKIISNDANIHYRVLFYTTHNIQENAPEIVLNGREIVLIRNNSGENGRNSYKYVGIMINDANIHYRVLFYTNGA